MKSWGLRRGLETTVSCATADHHAATSGGTTIRQNPLLFFGYFIGYFKRKQGLKQDNLTGLLDSAIL
jgi:hypothetical protein